MNLPSLPFRYRFLALLLPTVAALCTPAALAQARPAASKINDVFVFGGYSYLRPDFGPFGDQGGTFGVDYTRYFHFLSPSLEGRVNVERGTNNNQNTYLFGFRAERQVLQRYHPYGTAMIGPGTIHFNFPKIDGRTSDNSVVFAAGAGVDVDIKHNFGAKIDYQGQHWKTGTNNTLSPSTFLVGITYRVPFKKHEQGPKY